MSAPMRSCAVTADSGVSRWSDPSYTERKRTPSSSIAGPREDLVATGIGERETVPAGELAQPAQRRDHVHSRAEHQVVRVGEDDLAPEPRSRRRRDTSPLQVPTGMKHGVRCALPCATPARAPSRALTSMATGQVIGRGW